MMELSPPGADTPRPESPPEAFEGMRMRTRYPTGLICLKVAQWALGD